MTVARPGSGPFWNAPCLLLSLRPQCWEPLSSISLEAPGGRSTSWKPILTAGPRAVALPSRERTACRAPVWPGTACRAPVWPSAAVAAAAAAGKMAEPRAPPLPPRRASHEASLKGK